MNGIVYANDGDWVESCTALVEHQTGQLEIVTWSDFSEALAETEGRRPAGQPEEEKAAA